MNILGYDVGGTKISAVIGDESGRIIDYSRKATIRHLGKERLTEQLISMGDDLRQRHGIDRFDSIGIIFAGLVDSKNGRVVSSPNLLGLNNYDITKPLEKHFHTKAYLENDATGATIAEKIFGGGRNSDNFIYITLSTGIGGGAFVDGHLLMGHNGMAGEFGHTVIMSNGPTCGCGRKGCLEAIAGGKGIARRISENITAVRDSDILSKIPPNLLTAQKAFEAMQKGDMLSRLIIEETIYYLAIGIVNIACILDPEIIIIGGGISNAGNQLFVPLRRAVREEFKGMYRNVKIIRGLRNGSDIASISVPIYKRENGYAPFISSDKKSRGMSVD